MNLTRSLQREYATRTGNARPLMRAVCSSLRSAVSLYSLSSATADVSDGVVISTVAPAIGKACILPSDGKTCCAVSIPISFCTEIRYEAELAGVVAYTPAEIATNPARRLKLRMSALSTLSGTAILNINDLAVHSNVELIIPMSDMLKSFSSKTFSKRTKQGLGYHRFIAQKANSAYTCETRKRLPPPLETS